MKRASHVPEVQVLDPLDATTSQDDEMPEQSPCKLNSLSSSLKFFKGSVGASPSQMMMVKTLLDCGASHSFVSLQVAEKLGNVRWRKLARPVAVELPNGERMETRASCTVLLTLGGWKGRLKVWSLDLPGYDVILGLNFLEENNPQLDWPTACMRLKDAKGHTHKVFATDGVPLETEGAVQLNLMTRKQAVRAMRKKETEALLYCVRKTTPEVENHVGSSVTKDPRVQKLLEKYSNVFPEELPKQLPPERNIRHDIDTGDAAPVNINAYPLSYEKMQEQARQVEELVEKGLIRPSASPWGFPVIFVKKSDGKWRMCIDYRALNGLTKKNGYPLPRIQELLDIVGRAKVLSKIDLVSGYWQMRMADEAVPKTAFNTIWGKYEWLAMPFGLCNAPATFQTLMNETLRPLLGRCVVVYLDDILDFSESMDDHVAHLEEILRLLQSQKLYAKATKCVFATNQLEFCGHVIGNGSVAPMADKVRIIQDWPRPKTVHDVRLFLGLATYYRRFVKGFAQIAAPLHELLKEGDEELRRKKHRPIQWTTACEAAFGKLKVALQTAPVLAQPNRSKPFLIETDASEWALGYVLLQVGEDGLNHPVAFDGRKLRGPELNYPTHEKELLAIKEALRLWDRFIENGTVTTVLTDHEGLRYLSTTKTYSKRLARWVEEFQAYNLDIRYRKGAEAVVPDAISRRADFVEDTPANVAQGKSQWAARLTALRAVGGFPEDEWLSATIDFLRDGTIPTDKGLRRQVEKFSGRLSLRKEPLPMRATTVQEERLVYTYEDGVNAPYLEPPFRADFIRQAYKEFGHLRYPSLNGVLRGRGWWPLIRTDVEETIRRYPNC